MKVIAFNGSPHKDGVIHAGIKAMCAPLEASGIEVEFVQVGGELIHGCTGCGNCRAKGRCRIDGDIVNECIEKTRAAGGIILGSPVYYGGVAGAFKCFLDRMFYTGVNLEWKAGAVVASCRRSGGVAAFHQLCNYLTLAGAVIVPTAYWNVIHGTTKDEARGDEEGLWTMEAVGKNMAWLMKTLEAARTNGALPAHGQRPRTNFIEPRSV